MEELRTKAMSMGASEFGKSSVKGKRFYVIYDGRRINFGSNSNNTYIDHGDAKLRDAWRKRHSKIKLKDGRFAYTVPSQADHWAYKLLW